MEYSCRGSTSTRARGHCLIPTLATLSLSCSSMLQVKRIHARLLRNIDLFIINRKDHLILAKLLRFAAVSPSGDLNYAHLLFSQMQQPNTFFYNTIIRGFAKSHHPSRSISLFKQMRQDSVPPDEFTFTFVLKARSRSLSSSPEFHSQVLKFGFCSYVFVQNALLHFYATNAIPTAAQRVFEEMSVPDVVSWSGLVVAYVKSHELIQARHCFEEMPERDVVSWTTMISGYAQAGFSREALELFQEMWLAGVRPDEVTMVGVISACASLGDLYVGIQIHQYIDESGFSWMVSLCNALIDMYSKCGCMEKAWGVFDKMEKKSLISWNSIISACAVHGIAEEAVRLFEDMVESGVMPDSVTFLAVLSACVHRGWINYGRSLFERMQGEYRIEAGVEHYGCLVDMLGRAGCLEEAYELIMDMPIASNDVVWGTLLGACRIHGDVYMGEMVVKELLQLKPDEGGYYLLLCNIYLATGRHVEALEMRQIMKDRGAKKNPGFSWLRI